MTTFDPTQPPVNVESFFNTLILELQRENARLQRLVSELLLKNQLLRNSA